MRTKIQAVAEDPDGRRTEASVSNAAPTSFDVRTVALSIIAAALVIFLLQSMRAVLIPLVLAALLCYALDPFVDAMGRWRVPRAIGAAIMIGVVVSSTGSLAYLVQDDAVSMVEQIPASLRRARQELRRHPREPGVLDKVQAAAKEIETTTAEQTGGRAPSGVTRVQIEEPVFRAADYLRAGSVGAVSLVNQSVMILFLAYFMLLSNDLFRRRLIEVVGPRLEDKRITLRILEEISQQIERFLLVQVVTSSVVAVTTGLALWGFGLGGAALWGFLAGALNSIPYYGPLIVTAGLALVAFLQFGTLAMAAAVAGAALLITTLEGYLLTPMLMGRVARMNNVAVFVGLLFWSWVWGIPGMLLAVPMMMIVKAVCDRVEDFQPIGRFLGE